MQLTADNPTKTSPDVRTTKTLGVLLREQRTDDRLPLGKLALSCGVDRSVVEAVEVDKHELTVDELAHIVDAYGGAAIDAQMSSTALSIDIERMCVGLIATSEASGDALPADRILRRYLLLLQADRGVPIGTEFSVREIDLSLMRNALALRPAAVVSQLAEIGAVDDAQMTEGFFLRHRSLLLAGLLCGAVALGIGANAQSQPFEKPMAEMTTSIVSKTPPLNEAATVVEVITDIGTAVSISRSPETEAVSGEITVEIGTAAVLER